MSIKLYDSELRVMDILWKEGDKTAKELAAALNAAVGWSKTTTYTVIKKCIDKKAVARTEPGFVCHALVSRRQIQEYETDELIEKMYGGAADGLVACLLGRGRLTPQEVENLKKLVEELS